MAPKCNPLQFRFLEIGQGGLQHEVYIEGLQLLAVLYVGIPLPA